MLCGLIHNPCDGKAEMIATELDALRDYRLMLLERTIDERDRMLNRQGKVPLVSPSATVPSTGL